MLLNKAVLAAGLVTINHSICVCAVAVWVFSVSKLCVAFVAVLNN